MNEPCHEYGSVMDLTCVGRWAHRKSHAPQIMSTTTPCNTLQHEWLHPATPCNTLQHPATPCNTLQHTATTYNILQRTCGGSDTRSHSLHIMSICSTRDIDMESLCACGVHMHMYVCVREGNYMDKMRQIWRRKNVHLNRKVQERISTRTREKERERKSLCQPVKKQQKVRERRERQEEKAKEGAEVDPKDNRPLAHTLAHTHTHTHKTIPRAKPNSKITHSSIRTGKVRNSSRRKGIWMQPSKDVPI